MLNAYFITGYGVEPKQSNGVARGHLRMPGVSTCPGYIFGRMEPVVVAHVVLLRRDMKPRYALCGDSTNDMARSHVVFYKMP